MKLYIYTNIQVYTRTYIHIYMQIYRRPSLAIWRSRSFGNEKSGIRFSLTICGGLVPSETENLASDSRSQFVAVSFLWERKIWHQILAHSLWRSRSFGNGKSGIRFSLTVCGGLIPLGTENLASDSRSQFVAVSPPWGTENLAI